MPIKAFKRVDNYFSGFKTLKANALDGQFNMIGQYLNTEAVKLLNQLSADKIPGSANPADANKFLQNVGDGTTKWGVINNDSFANYDLPLAKLIKTNIGSILASNQSEQIEPVSATSNEQSLVSRNNDTPIWQSITGESIADRSITGESIADGTITNRNLPAYLIENIIVENSITGDKFQNESITNQKIANNTLAEQKLSSSLVESFPTAVWSNIIPDDYLKTINQMINPVPNPNDLWETIIRLFNDSSKPVRINHFTGYGTGGKPTINTVIPESKFMNDGANKMGFSAYNVFGQVKAETKLKDNSINAPRVAVGYRPSSPNHLDDMRAYIRVPMHEMVAANAVQIRHFRSDIRRKLEGN